MSSDPNIKPPTNIKYILGVCLALTIMVAIALTAVILYFVNQPKPLATGPAEERKAKLAQVNATQNEIISEYDWVDQPNGVVRIPVARAMQLTIEKLEKSTTTDKTAAPEQKKDSSES